MKIIEQLQPGKQFLDKLSNPWTVLGIPHPGVKNFNVACEGRGPTLIMFDEEKSIFTDAQKKPIKQLEEITILNGPQPQTSNHCIEY